MRKPALSRCGMRTPGSVLYATSNDGIHWERPILNIAGETNRTDLHLHSPSIIDDNFETDPQKTLQSRRQREQGRGRRQAAATQRQV